MKILIYYLIFGISILCISCSDDDGTYVLPKVLVVNNTNDDIELIASTQSTLVEPQDCTYIDADYYRTEDRDKNFFCGTQSSIRVSDSILIFPDTVSVEILLKHLFTHQRIDDKYVQKLAIDDEWVRKVWLILNEPDEAENQGFLERW